MARKALPNRQIAEEAAEWAVRIDAGPLTPSERGQLADWLTASPVHSDELLLSASLLTGIERLDGRDSPSIEALLAEPAPVVIPLSRSSQDKSAANAGRSAPESSPGWRYGRAARAAVAASVVLLVAASAAVLVPGSLSERAPSAADAEALPHEKFSGRLVRTGFGEQRSIVLEDGSVLYVNTDSQLRVTLTETARRIDLLRGEALFEVAHDSARPFRVHAGRTVAQAVGTKFNVERTADGVTVVVVEGKVLVGGKGDKVVTKARGRQSRAGLANEPAQVLLVAGTRADVPTAAVRPAVSRADIETATAWRLRRVSFSDEPLADIAGEFNRYNRRKIVVADADLADTPLSGTFNADDPESFVAFLEMSNGVEVDKSEPGRVILRSAAD